MTLVVAQHVEGANITLAWDPPADPTTTGHVLWYGTESGNYAHQVDIGLQTSHTLTSLSEGTTYYFAVTAYNAAGETSAFSDEVSTVAGLGPPRNLAAAVTGALVQLQWQPPTNGGIFDYRIEAGLAPGRTDLGAITVAGATAFTVPNVPPGVYYVRVKAIKAGVAGPPSTEIQIIVGNVGCIGAPATPHSLRASASGALVQIDWQPGAGGQITGYVLEVGSASGLRDLAVLGIPTTSISSPAPNGTYYLRVRAVNGCGVSSPSPEVSVTVSDPTAMLPGAPVNLTRQVSGTTVVLTWKPGAGGTPQRYILEVANSAGTLIATADTGNSATSVTHPNTPPGRYVVRVRAANAAGIGPPSLPVVVEVPD